jgi:hypothetical protein
MARHDIWIDVPFLFEKTNQTQWVTQSFLHKVGFKTVLLTFIQSQFMNQEQGASPWEGVCQEAWKTGQTLALGSRRRSATHKVCPWATSTTSLTLHSLPCSWDALSASQNACKQLMWLKSPWRLACLTPTNVRGCHRAAFCLWAFMVSRIQEMNACASCVLVSASYVDTQPWGHMPTFVKYSVSTSDTVLDMAMQ